MTDHSFYKDYIATYKRIDDHLETLQWKAPGTSNRAMWFVRQYGTLMVFGDMGEAVYQWYPDITIESIGLNMSLERYVCKCKASEYGRRPYAWDAQQCDDDVNAYFDEFAKDRDHEYDPDDNYDLVDRAEEEMKFSLSWGWGATEEEIPWLWWVWENGADVFGQDYWDGHFPCKAGEKLSWEVQRHYEGLREAVKQLKEKGVS